MKSRYIPSPEIQNLKTQLQLSRIESKRGYLNSQGYNNIPSNDSPFHPVIYSDVQYPEPSLSKTNRCLTKYENKNPNMNDIALYDTRIYDLNASNVPRLADNVIYKNQMERARSKIQQAHTDLLPAFDMTNSPSLSSSLSSGSFTGNGTYYNPNLPISETNKPPPNLTPTLTDERISYHTNERPWNYESDRANIAYDLQRSPEIIERNRRQHEADDALFRRTKKNRWIEPKMAYMNRPYDPTYSIDEYIKKQSEKDNERITLSPIHAKEAFAQSRSGSSNPIGFDETDMNHLNKEIYGTFQQDYSRRMNELYERETLKSRLEQFQPNSDSSLPAKGSFLTNTASYITNTITSFFNWNSNGNSPLSPLTSLLSHLNSHITYSPDGSITYKDNAPLPAEVNTTLEQTLPERFYYKPDHVLVVKNGDIPDVFPDENYDYTAVSLVQSDPLNTGLVRTIVIKDDSKFKIIQKRAEDAIFTGDNRPYGEDFVSITIPIEYIDEKVRERIKKNNLDTKRDKVIELTYNDFIAFSDFIVNHPEVQERMKFSDLQKKVRGNKYDLDIINNFEGKKVFMDDKVYSVIRSDNTRTKQIKSNTGRIDKDQSLSSVETYLTPSSPSSTPIQTSLSPSSTSTSYRKTQLNDTQKFSVARSGKVKLNRFNQ